MTTYIEEFVAKLGFEVDGAALETFERRTERLKKTFSGVAKYAGIAVGAITGVVAIANRGTARVDALATSVGLTTENLLALSNAVRPLGFEVENVADLVEEMNNKLGESRGLGKPVGAVADAVRILGLQWETLRNQKPEEQFYTLIDAASKLEDSQKGAAALDMVFGGEASKILGYLRSYGKDIRSIIADQKRLNLLTEDGIQGAKKFDSAFLRLLTVGKSLVAESSGKLGEVLAPIINDMVDWIIANEDLVESELKKWIEDVGEFLVWLWETVRDLIVSIGRMTEKVGGLKNAFRIFLVVAGAVVAIQIGMWVWSVVVAVKALVVAIGGLSTVLAALKLAALGLKWLLIFGLIALIIEDLIGFLTGKDSVIGDLSKEFENLLEDANAYWAAVMGMDPEQFRTAFLGFFQQGWSSFFSDSLSQWGEWFSDLGKLILGFFTSIWSAAVDIVADVIEGIVNRIRDLFNSVIFSVQVAATSVLGFFVSIGNGIYDFFAGIGDAIRDLVSGAFEFVRSSLGRLVGMLPDRVKSFLGFEGGIPGEAPAATLGSRLREGVSGFASGIAPAFSPTPVAAAAGGMTFNVTVPTSLAVTQRGEMSPEELSRVVARQIGTEVSRAVRNTSEGVDY